MNMIGPAIGCGALGLVCGLIAARTVQVQTQVEAQVQDTPAVHEPALSPRGVALAVAILLGAALFVLPGIVPALALVAGMLAVGTLDRFAARTSAPTDGGALMAPAAALLATAGAFALLTGPLDYAPADHGVLTALFALALGGALPAAFGQAPSAAAERFAATLTALVAAMALPALLVTGVNAAELRALMALPPALAGVGVLVGCGAVRLPRPGDRPAIPAPLAALALPVLLAVGFWGVIALTLGSMNQPFGTDLDGLGGTSGRAVAGAAVTGLIAAFVLRTGRAASCAPVVAPLVLAAGVLVAHALAGPLGLAFAAIGMATLLLVPAPHPAGGATASAALTALALFAAYSAGLDDYNSALGLIDPPNFRLDTPYILAGLLLGAALPHGPSPGLATPRSVALRLGLPALAMPVLLYAVLAPLAGIGPGFAALAALMPGLALSALFAPPHPVPAGTGPQDPVDLRPAPCSVAPMLRLVPLTALLLLAVLGRGG